MYTEKITDKEKTSGKTVRKTDEVFDLIKADPQITREQLANETGLSVRGIEYHLKILRDTNRTSRVGSARLYDSAMKNRHGKTMNATGS